MRSLVKLCLLSFLLVNCQKFQTQDTRKLSMNESTQSLSHTPPSPKPITFNNQKYLASFSAKEQKKLKIFKEQIWEDLFPAFPVAFPTDLLHLIISFISCYGHYTDHLLDKCYPKLNLDPRSPFFTANWILACLDVPNRKQISIKASHDLEQKLFTQNNKIQNQTAQIKNPASKLLYLQFLRPHRSNEFSLFEIVITLCNSETKQKNIKNQLIKAINLIEQFQSPLNMEFHEYPNKNIWISFLNSLPNAALKNGNNYSPAFTHKELKFLFRTLIPKFHKKDLLLTFIGTGSSPLFKDLPNTNSLKSFLEKDLFPSRFDERKTNQLIDIFTEYIKKDFDQLKGNLASTDPTLKIPLKENPHFFENEMASFRERATEYYRAKCKIILISLIFWIAACSADYLIYFDGHSTLIGFLGTIATLVEIYSIFFVDLTAAQEWWGPVLTAIIIHQIVVGVYVFSLT